MSCFFITLNSAFYFFILYVMKKSILVVSLLALSLFFVWCEKKNQPVQVDNNPTPEETTVVVDNTDVDVPVDEVLPGEEEVQEEYVPWDYQTDTHEDMTFDEIGDALSKCDEMWENPVCWKDGGTYFNKCYLDFAGIEEETERAHVEDWICVFW